MTLDERIIPEENWFYEINLLQLANTCDIVEGMENQENEIVQTQEEVVEFKPKRPVGDYFRWWTNATLATKVTYARLALIPLILFFWIGAIEFNSDFFFSYGKLIAFLLFVVAVATDFLDGWIARRFNQVSDTGKLLDPICDKLLALTAFVLIVVDPQLMDDFDNMMPRFAAILIIFLAISRDYIVSVIRQLSAQKGIAMGADTTAKAKTVVMFIALALFMFYAADYNLNNPVLGVGTFFDVFRYISWFLMAVASGLTVISCGIYLYKYNKPKVEEIVGDDAEDKE